MTQKAAFPERFLLPMPDCKRYTVYVLRLPGTRYYVGSTGKLFSERLAEHQARFGRVTVVGKLRWCTTRGTAVNIERKLARELRRKGKEVIQG